MNKLWIINSLDKSTNGASARLARRTHTVQGLCWQRTFSVRLPRTSSRSWTGWNARARTNWPNANAWTQAPKCKGRNTGNTQGPDRLDHTPDELFFVHFNTLIRRSRVYANPFWLLSVKKTMMSSRWFKQLSAGSLFWLRTKCFCMRFLLLPTLNFTFLFNRII